MTKHLHFFFLSWILVSATIIPKTLLAQDELWHQKERTLHYRPSGKDFVLHKGTRKFNRALYGTNTAFRVETGDLPEFALYMPGMGGNCKIGISNGKESKWLTEADNIATTYRPGSMLYEIKDKLLQAGVIKIAVLAIADAEGMIVKIESAQIPKNFSLVIAYGAASGKKFSRDGDIGADPESSFYMQPEYCKDNIYKLSKNQFQLHFGFGKSLSEDERYQIQYGNKLPDTTGKVKPRLLKGVFPTTATIKITDAMLQASPIALLNSSSKSSTPVVVASINLAPGNTHYFFIENNTKNRKYEQAVSIFNQSEKARKAVAERITLETPDEYVNPMAGALAIAADGIWEAPTYLHGAVAWRMRLPAWRGAYAADALGWQDRARLHFDSYLKSQVTNIPPGAVEPDTVLHFTRQKERMGNAMFSNGYICRHPDGKIQPHHYDMNLVFIDQLLTHLKYTGDIDYIKKVWPSIKLHLQWEKRNFDADGDGLYDAYACIWASDALQYSGGGVTHSTSYNYRANKIAAQLAKLLSQDASLYEAEASKILNAMNQKLWAKDKGTFAEYKDLQGLQLLHTAPGLWTIYHAIDGETATPLQQYQMLRYVDYQIPHIPVMAKNLPFKDLYLLSTTNWQPYTWSVNNVALAENLHTSLAYWQSNESTKAFHLWKSALVESMYLGASPGNFQQLSFYDAVRGELYRDFADPIGVAARTLTEGLFGIVPDALNGSLHIQPGYPSDWKFAKLGTPNISFDFKKHNNQSNYKITQRYEKLMRLQLRINATHDQVTSVYVNGQKASYHWATDALHQPEIEIEAKAAQSYSIQINWAGNPIEDTKHSINTIKGTETQISFSRAKVLSVIDPQDAFTTSIQKNVVKFIATKESNHSLFVALQQGSAKWIAPISINTLPIITIDSLQEPNNQTVSIKIKNNSTSTMTGMLTVNNFKEPITLNPSSFKHISISSSQLIKGTNTLTINWENGQSDTETIQCWSIPAKDNYEAIDISSTLNDNVTNTFKNQYLSPRTTSTALQIPWQGIGNWCYPLIQPEIADEGIEGKEYIHLDKIPFRLGSNKNIAYTSQWDNFPESIRIPLTGKSSHAYLLMTGTTNHQQSQMANGVVYVEYSDGSKDSLELINPKNWWPIEQDYRNDGYAFVSGIQPYRLIFKTGTFTRTYKNHSTIKGFTDMAIEGGAATLLDLPLNKNKELKSLTFKAITNEVLIGLMSLTLERP